MNNKSKEKLQLLLASEKVQAGHEIIRIVSGLTRYRIITILQNNPNGLTVTDLAKVLKATPSQTSHQLRILKKYNLVLGIAEGRSVLYTLNFEKAEPFLL